MAFACVSPVAPSYRWLKQSWKIESLPIFLWNKILCLNQRLPCIYLHAIVSFYFAARLLNSGDIFVAFPKCGICSELSFRALSPFLPHLKKKIPPALSLCISTLPLAEMWGDRECICKCFAHAYVPNEHDIIFELKTSSLKHCIFYTAQQCATARNKNGAAEGTEVGLRWLDAPVYPFVCTGTKPAGALPEIQQRHLLQHRGLGVAVCEGMGGWGHPKGRLQPTAQRNGGPQTVASAGPHPGGARDVQGVVGSFCCSLVATQSALVLSWDCSPPPHPNAHAFDGFCSDRLYELLGDDHTRWGRGQIALLSPLARWKDRYYVESHTTAISEGDSQLLCKQKRALHAI